MLATLRQTLGNVGLYLALQKGIGADRIRYRCLDEAELKPGDRILDVGCGPAYYFDRLPEVSYVGFDTSAPYIAYARKRYGDRGEFRCEVLTEEPQTMDEDDRWGIGRTGHVDPPCWRRGGDRGPGRTVSRRSHVDGTFHLLRTTLRHFRRHRPTMIPLPGGPGLRSLRWPSSAGLG